MIEENNEAVSEGDENVNEEIENNSPIAGSGGALSSSDEKRVRRPPMWMRDYMSGEGLSEEDIDINLALFASADPAHFEEAIRCEKWRATMDLEIKAIERKNTWKLTNLPTGAKKIRVK